MNFTPSLAPELAGLPTPQVLETLRFETVFDALLRDFQVRYPQYSALLASDPVIKLIEVAAYRELLLRARGVAGARPEALRALESVGVLEQAHRRPTDMSGGQRQRVGVARAIAGERAVVVVNHVSFLDGVLLGAFLPGRPTFAVNTHIAKAWWVKPFLGLFQRGRVEIERIERRLDPGMGLAQFDQRARKRRQRRVEPPLGPVGGLRVPEQDEGAHHGLAHGHILAYACPPEVSSFPATTCASGSPRANRPS